MHYFLGKQNDLSKHGILYWSSNTYVTLGKYGFPSYTSLCPHQSDSKGITKMTKIYEGTVVADSRNCNKGKTSGMFHSILQHVKQ